MGFDSISSQVIHLPRQASLSSVAPPQPGQSALQEALCAHPADPSATGFVLASLRDAKRPVLWVQDRGSLRENGRLSITGAQRLFGGNPVLCVHVNHPRDVLWTMEEGAACAGLAAVVGEIYGAPAVLDFTATKRLALRAQKSGVPVWLIRSGDPGGLSAARERWRLGALPSSAHPYDPRAPGAPLWDADLFRASGRAPGRWVAQYENGAQNRLRLVSRSGDGSVAGDNATLQNAAC